jgi:hypothetical protein
MTKENDDHDSDATGISGNDGGDGCRLFSFSDGGGEGGIDFA